MLHCRLNVFILICALLCFRNNKINSTTLEHEMLTNYKMSKEALKERRNLYLRFSLYLNFFMGVDKM